MSVTVGDLLKLPSFREAKVVAGHEGLKKFVTSVSVLEYADPNALQDSLFRSGEFFGSEIIITAFANVPNDFAVQCANIRRLAQVGEVGMILYYVGVFVPYVHQSLIELADSLDFTIIVMPEKRMDLRYSEAIFEIFEAIRRDEEGETTLVADLLERVSRLPPHQRTMDAILKMVSDRLRASLILTDESGRVLNEAAWPRALAAELMSILSRLKLPNSGAPPTKWADLHVYRADISAERAEITLLLFKAGEELPQTTLRQLIELIRLSLNLFSAQHSQVAVRELVRAILQDEPMKMQRLAEIFHVDVKSINAMWILRDVKRAADWVTPSLTTELKQLLGPYCTSVIMDVYEDEFVIFMNEPRSFSDEVAMRDMVIDCAASHGIRPTLTCCNRLPRTVEVRAAFLCNQRHLKDARRIFPLQRIFRLPQIQFAEECRTVFHRGELSVQEETEVLQPLLQDEEDAELVRTLGVYVLDAQESVTRTAELLFVHKNTVKYRLQRGAERLGFRIGHQPETMRLYRALALWRMRQ